MNRFVKGSLLLVLAGPATVVAAPAAPGSVSPLKSVEQMLQGGHRIPLTPQERGLDAAAGAPPSAPVPPQVPKAPAVALPSPASVEPVPAEHGSAPPAPAPEHSPLTEGAGGASTPASETKPAADIPSGVVTVQSVGDVKQLGEALKRATEQMNRNDGE